MQATSGLVIVDENGRITPSPFVRLELLAREGLAAAAKRCQLEPRLVPVAQGGAVEPPSLPPAAGDGLLAR